MKLRKGLIATTIALALIVPTTVFATTSTSATAVKIRGLFGIDSSKLTATQLADVKDYAQKMADLQKSLLDKMVSNGSMTQAQADAQKAKIDSDLANGEYFVGGGGRGQKGDGNAFGKGIDASKLTADQKTNLLALEKEQLSLENDLASVLVEQKLITQAQADAIKTKVDAAVAALTTADTTRGVLRGCVGTFSMLQDVTLTDAQKTAIQGWASKEAAVEKKIVALYKDAGAITQAQADTMNAQIDKMASDPLSFTMKGNDKMGGFRMGGRHKGFDGNRNSDSSQNSSATVTQ